MMSLDSFVPQSHHVASSAPEQKQFEITAAAIRYSKKELAEIFLKLRKERKITVASAITREPDLPITNRQPILSLEHLADDTAHKRKRN